MKLQTPGADFWNQEISGGESSGRKLFLKVKNIRGGESTGRATLPCSSVSTVCSYVLVVAKLYSTVIA